jgi:hypothetical protein
VNVLRWEKTNHKDTKDTQRSQGSKMIKGLILILPLILMISSPVQSQNYYLNVQGGVGYARFITDMDQTGLDQNGIISSFRIMWEPEHLLLIGLESGYNSLYTYEESDLETDFGTTDAKSSLSSIPLFFVISMKIIPSINLMAGFGPSYLKTSFDAFGWQTKSTQISTSFYVAAAYNYPLNHNLSVGGEFRWYQIRKIEDGTLSLQLTLGYKLLTW